MISVIVPIFNADKYIEKCILSILNQTYSDLELILIDDGSQDQSYIICQKYQEIDSRIIIYHQDNQGVSAARNKGLQLSNGEYIMFVDADDTLEKDAINKALTCLITKNADLVVYGWRIINDVENTCENVTIEAADTDNISDVIYEVLKHYSAYGGGYPWNKIWRKSIFYLNGSTLPEFNDELFYFEDLEWVIRMLLGIKKVAVCSEILYNYYIHQESVTHSREKAEKREIGYHQSINKIIEDLCYLPDLQKWFSEKYYPEIVNGIIHARQNKWNNLNIYLTQLMLDKRSKILKSPNVSINIKLRCIFVGFLK